MTEPVRTHQACPHCPSSDAYAYYPDGSGHCFSCGYTDRKGTHAEYEGESRVTDEDKPPVPIPQGGYQAIPGRKLSRETCQKYDISVAQAEGKEYQIYGYYAEGAKVAAKVRGLPKCFNPKEDPHCGFKGHGKTPTLFGMQAFTPNKKIAITVCEGELDAASYYQMTGYPAVSVRSSGQAYADVEECYEWLNGYREIVFCFDKDEAGKKAFHKVKHMFPGKTKVLWLSKHKDPSDYLMAGDVEEFSREWFNAKPIQTDGIITGASAILKKAKKKPQKGIPSVWNGLNDITRGIRTQEVWVFGGGTGLGKSETLKEMAFGLMKMHEAKVGMIMLEESSERTIQCLLGKELKKRYYLEDVEFPSDEELSEAAESLGPYLSVTDSLKSEWEEIKRKIEYMVNGLGIKYIFVDHLTAIAEGKNADVNASLHMILEQLNHMAVSLDCTFFCVSHLNQSANKNHEEGARVTLRDFYGSAAIKQRAHYCFGFEGDLTGVNIKQHLRIMRCLKDRPAGDGGGKTVELEYDQETGLLEEVENTFEEIEE